MTTAGYVQIYTGNGKGKTTAALGLALRSLVAGMNVFLGQFVKSDKCRGVIGLERAASASDEGTLHVDLYGRDRTVMTPFESADADAATSGLERVRAALGSGQYDVVILDEFNIALSCGLICREDAEDLLARRPANTELVLTGRGAPEYLIDRADLVTRMDPMKHYYQAGVRSRVGVEE